MENKQLPKEQIDLGLHCLKMYVDSVIRDEMIKWISTVKEGTDVSTKDLSDAVNSRVLKEVKEAGNEAWKKNIELIKTQTK